MTEIKNETGTKKKLLIPVVVLMLLAVGLTGAAYAYNSTLSVNNNTVDANTLTIDLTNGDASISPAGIKAATFTDNISYEWNADKTPEAGYDKYNTVMGSGNEGLAFTYNVTVGGTATANKITVSSTNIEDYYATTIGTTTIGAMYKIAVGTTNNVASATVLEDNDAVLEITISKTAENTVAQTVYVFVVATDANDDDKADVVEVHARGIFEDSWKASSYTDDILAASFTLFFDATQTA
jgi:hypothetical protein